MAQSEFQDTSNGAAKQRWFSKSYVSPKCSPSRAALLTGLYPWRLGIQRGAIERFQPTGLNPNKVLLPELLQKGGYATHLVGELPNVISL